MYIYKILILLSIPGMAMPPHVETGICCENLPLNCLSIEATSPNYDEILNLITLIEQGELDDRLSNEDLEKIINYMCSLAVQGSDNNNPIESILLSQDIYALQTELRNDIHYLFTKNFSDSFFIAPSVNYDSIKGIQCKSWVSKHCHSLKKFVKKHKKAIIIGAAIVVAATITVIAIAALSTTAAATSAAGLAGATVSGLDSVEKDNMDSISSDKHKEKDTIQSQPKDSFESLEHSVSNNKTLTLANIVDEKIDLAKITLIENSRLEDCSLDTNSNQKSFSAKARDLGACVAHQILDAAATLGSFVPEIQNEAIDISKSLLPESLIIPPSLRFSDSDSVTCYRDTIQEIHEKIDQVFDTNQAEFYSPEAKARNALNDYSLGILPPPAGGFIGKKGWELKNAEYQITRNGVTTIEGRCYRGHAIDQMQNRGIPPSVVEQTIQNGKIVNTDSVLGTIEYYDSTNGIKVILNEKEEIVTVMRANGR